MTNKEKAIGYNRVSTKDKDQNPELQKEDCLRFAKENDLEVVDVLPEEGSAYNIKKKRPVWEEVQRRAIKEKLNIIVWRYDRVFRNRKEFYKFMKIMFEQHSLKVYSVKEPSIMSFWKLVDQTYSDNPVFNNMVQGLMKVLWDFLIQLTGEQAEEDSRKIGDRVKLAVRKQEGRPTKSYKGNHWGRKPLSKNVINQVLELHKQGLSIRGIAKQVFYYDKNNNKKQISVSGVHKLIKENSN